METINEKCKFVVSLTRDNKSIKAARAKIIAEDAYDAQSEIVRTLSQEKREIEKQLLKLSDTSPDSEFSLKVVKDNFKASEWAKSIQALKVQLAMKEVEVKVAVDTFNEWFGNEEQK